GLGLDVVGGRELGLFFFQAEDGIRDGHVTGVQTCALPISRAAVLRRQSFASRVPLIPPVPMLGSTQTAASGRRASRAAARQPACPPADGRGASISAGAGAGERVFSSPARERRQCCLPTPNPRPPDPARHPRLRARR